MVVQADAEQLRSVRYQEGSWGEFPMRRPTPLQVLSAAAAITFLTGCSDVSAIAPKSVPPQGDAQSAMGEAPIVLGLTGVLKINSNAGHPFKSFDKCPAAGPIKYVSDYTNNVINVYVGKFAGQGPCGQIGSGWLNGPVGLFVEISTHDLYAANQNGRHVVVFHRGQTNPYNIYTDPTGNLPFDVAVSKDGTVITSDVQASISTWIGGPDGGRFVGNFPMANAYRGAFVTVQKNGTVYYDGYINSQIGYLWYLTCPAGACGPQTKVAGVSLWSPGGMAVDGSGDLLVTSARSGFAHTYELPDPNSKMFPLIGVPYGMAINERDHHWFTADPVNNYAAEYLYPSGTFVGSVPGNAGGAMFGIAVDP